MDVEIITAIGTNFVFPICAVIAFWIFWTR